jgi:hypothetical protein
MKGKIMDKVSKLLAEARPLYQRKQKEKKALFGGLISVCLALGIFWAEPQTTHFDDENFDSYFTALYLSDTVNDEDFIYDDDVIPLNSYGLYEVS